MAEPLDYQFPSPARRHSVAGIVSCALAGVALLGLPASVLLRHNASPPPPPGSPGAGGSAATMAVVGVIFLMILVGSPLLGTLLGGIGVMSRTRRRVFAVVGLAVNGSILLFVAALFLLRFFLK